MAVVRFFLLLQLFTVFPLIMYIFRCQVLMLISKTSAVSYKKIYFINSMVLSVCVCFAIFIPSIGKISLRFHEKILHYNSIFVKLNIILIAITICFALYPQVILFDTLELYVVLWLFLSCRVCYFCQKPNPNPN